MTLTQLRYVLALARHGSFGKAAQHSLVAQPTLSIQIQKLEQELGIEIFDRKKSPIRLTEPGKKVEAYARRILDEADSLLEEFEDDYQKFVELDFSLEKINSNDKKIQNSNEQYLHQFLNRIPTIDEALKISLDFKLPLHSSLTARRRVGG